MYKTISFFKGKSHYLSQSLLICEVIGTVAITILNKKCLKLINSYTCTKQYHF